MKKLDTNGITLLEQERNLIFQWRSLRDAVLEVAVQNGLPVHGRINVTGLMQRTMVGSHKLTDYEVYIIEWLRKLSYGRLILLVRDGTPTLAETNSYANLKFDQLPEGVEFEG